MQLWTLSSGQPVLGVCVRLGENGPLLPTVRGAVLVAGQRQPGTVAQARFPTTTHTVSVRISQTDILKVATAGPVNLTATLYHPDGMSQMRRTVMVSGVGPEGLVFALLTSDGSYYTAEGLPDSGRLTVTTAQGSYTVDNPAGGVSFAPGKTALPTRITMTDDEGRVSDDLLAGVEVETSIPEGSTSLSAWPLPPYLQANQPNLGAYLRAFASALDVQPEQASRYLHLATSSDEPLRLLGDLYGAARTEALTDAEVIRRVQAAMLPAKDSLTGLTLLLHAYGVFGGEVVDVMKASGGKMLTLDGTWLLNGEYNLDGGYGHMGLEPGEVAAVFRRIPSAGLKKAVEVMQRYKAAGIRSLVIYRQEPQVSEAAVGMRFGVTWRATLPLLSHISVPFLTLDGTWLLDGQQELDGIRNPDTPPAP